MKVIFTNYLVAFLLCFCTLSVSAQQPTANQVVKPYTADFGFGSNMGYYGTGWNDKGLVTIVNKAGGNTVRPTLPEHFVDKWGYPIRLSEFQYYANSLGMKDLTVFIEGPSEAHRDKTIYPGCTTSSGIFANLYEPIWNADGSVNANNYYANYVYKLVQLYGPYIRNWEVLNEPDLGANGPAEWLTRAPLASELNNIRAPFYYYIRMLRITWEVVKKYNPDDFITPGGIGHATYLDALLRYTDNPNGGAVSSQYPNKGGAYFDMLSYHVYPTFFLRTWDNSIRGFKYLRNSDYAAAQIIKHRDGFESVFQKYGYDGVTYPKKHYIVTETNISRRAVDWRYSSDEMQRNFGMKALVLAQKNGIKQVYFYSSGESVDAPSTETVTGSTEYSLMGLYENLRRDLSGSEKLSPLGKGFKTTSLLLQGYDYDAARTAALNLPAAVEGGAFKKDGEFVYVLWAKNPNDKSETFSQPYSFPAALNISTVYRYEWDYYATGKNTQQSPTGITLNTAPSFFKANVNTVAKQSQTITFTNIADKVYGTAPFSLQASATSGLAVSYRVVSGPATLSGSTLTLTGTGTVNVEASQSGNTTYNAAPAVSQSFLVSVATSAGPSNRIEAEQYASMSGINTEKTTDVDGGLNVGWIDVNDWMKYNVNVSAAGTYTLNFRVAGTSDGQFEVRNSSGAVLKTVDVPTTGGWQSWKTVSVPVALNSGSQTLQIYIKDSGWNFNWFEVGGTTTAEPAEQPTTTSTRIEAEKYASMSGINTETTSDVGGGQNVGRLDANDWLKYNINVSATGTYTLNFRVAGNTGGQFEVRNSSGAVLKTADVPTTGGWQSWKTVSVPVALNSGSQTLQIYVKKSGWNFNWFEIAGATSTAQVQSARSQFTEDLSVQNSLDAAFNWSVYPNPVTTQATVAVRVPEATLVTLEVRDMQGKLVRQLFSGNLSAETNHQFTLEAENLAAGIYFTRLITPSQVYNQKIIVKH